MDTGNTHNTLEGQSTSFQPSAAQVEAIHTNSDLDSRPEAQHHTLGPSPMQASPGDHTHNGGSSPLIIDPASYTVHILNTDSATGAQLHVWRTEVEAILKRLGANVIV